MANTLRIIGAGGAGINITNEIGANLANLGDGFCNVERYYIDTSNNDTPEAVLNDPNTYFVKTQNLSKDKISGSGGVRKTHAADINTSVKDFLDHYGLTKKKTDVYTLVVFSLSGGTGSVVSPMLLKNLLEKDIPTIAVCIGDSTNGLFAINTMNSIATLHNIALKTKKPLSVMYVNNESYISNGIKSAIGTANKVIFNSLSALSLFLSGENKSLDTQDMINIIDQSKYAGALSINPGLYALSTFSKDVILPEGCIATVGRTLTTNAVSPDINLSLLHHKTGTILSDNAIAIYNDHVPIHLVTYLNFFTIEEQKLRQYTDNIYNSMNAIQVNQLSGTENSEIDDDGMVY